MSAHGRTVLIVDDEDDIRWAVRMTLEDAGYSVLEAPNGVVGLDLLRASAAPLVVLLDLMMPSMSGLELLHAVRAESEVAARHAFILFSAAHTFTAPTLRLYLPSRRLLDLPKPFDLDHLLGVVEQAAQQLHRDSERDADNTDKALVAQPVQTTDHHGGEGSSDAS